MSAEPGGSQFDSKLPALPADAEFYVVAEGIRSPSFRVRGRRRASRPQHHRQLRRRTPPPMAIGSARRHRGQPGHRDKTSHERRGAGVSGGQPLQLSATQNNRTTATLTITAYGLDHVGVQPPANRCQSATSIRSSRFATANTPKARPPISPRRLLRHPGPVPAEDQKAVRRIFPALRRSDNGHTRRRTSLRSSTHCKGRQHGHVGLTSDLKKTKRIRGGRRNGQRPQTDFRRANLSGVVRSHSPGG